MIGFQPELLGDLPQPDESLETRNLEKRELYDMVSPNPKPPNPKMGGCQGPIMASPIPLPTFFMAKNFIFFWIFLLMATTPQTPKASPLVFLPFQPSVFLVPDPKTGRKSSKTFCNPLCNPDLIFTSQNPKTPKLWYPEIRYPISTNFNYLIYNKTKFPALFIWIFWRLFNCNRRWIYAQLATPNKRR